MRDKLFKPLPCEPTTMRGNGATAVEHSLRCKSLSRIKCFRALCLMFLLHTPYVYCQEQTLERQRKLQKHRRRRRRPQGSIFNNGNSDNRNANINRDATDRHTPSDISIVSRRNDFRPMGFYAGNDPTSARFQNSIIESNNIIGKSKAKSKTRGESITTTSRNGRNSKSKTTVQQVPPVPAVLKQSTLSQSTTKRKPTEGFFTTTTEVPLEPPTTAIGRARAHRGREIGRNPIVHQTFNITSQEMGQKSPPIVANISQPVFRRTPSPLRRPVYGVSVQRYNVRFPAQGFSGSINDFFKAALGAMGVNGGGQNGAFGGGPPVMCQVVGLQNVVRYPPPAAPSSGRGNIIKGRNVGTLRLGRGGPFGPAGEFRHNLPVAQFGRSTRRSSKGRASPRRPRGYLSEIELFRNHSHVVWPHGKLQGRSSVERSRSGSISPGFIGRFRGHSIQDALPQVQCFFGVFPKTKVVPSRNRPLETPLPSTAPSLSFSPSVSQAPSSIPSISSAPSLSPSFPAPLTTAPTSTIPTLFPTSVRVPTSPTATVTSAPTITPTLGTVAPSSSVTTTPTARTAMPSSRVVTVAPTTKGTTTTPTTTPTTASTGIIFPTVMPTLGAGPTVSPSMSQTTQAPTIAVSPTMAPSMAPSIVPTTVVPTQTPTIVGTATPTFVPPPAGTKSVIIKAMMQYGFFAGSAQEPTQDEVTAVMNQTSAFYLQYLQGFYNNLEGFQAFAVNTTYDPNATLPVTVDFDGYAFFNQSSANIPSMQKVLVQMSKANYQNYIMNYVWNSVPVKQNVFYNTMTVAFNARSSSSSSSSH